MQATINPQPGNVSLPASMADELERIRFSLALIEQKISGAATPPFWYTAAADFSGIVSFSPTAARLESTVPVSILTNAQTQMTFNTTVYDTASMTTGLGTVASALTAPATGVYICGGTLGFGDGISTGIAGNFRLRLRMLRLNGSFLEIASNQIDSTFTPSEPKLLTVETVKHFQKGDLLQMTVVQTDGNPTSPTSNAIANPALWMAMVARG